MTNKEITVKLVYRNYKGLHSTYQSLIDTPPTGIKYIYNEPQKYISNLLPLYRRYSKLAIFRWILPYVQKIFFEKENKDENIDLLHYIQIRPQKAPDIPFIIDIEHISALNNFLEYSEKDKKELFDLFNNKLCLGIIALSKAAANSIHILFGEEQYKKISNKVNVIYPAVPIYSKIYSNILPSDNIENNNDLRILFIGSNPHTKGLFELLEALKELYPSYPNITTHIISNTNSTIHHKYALPNIHFHKPRYSREELITQYYLRSDLFILPTRGDTFGMVFLEALASKVPVITVDQYATPEIIRDKENGYLLKSKYNYINRYPIPTKEITQRYKKKGIDKLLVEELKGAIRNLYNNPTILKNFKQRCLVDFEEDGKFTIDRRNKLLNSIYQKSL